MACGALALLSGCGGMTRQEKEMVGNYYIPALSDTRPVMELRDGNRSVLRAIRPGELSYCVDGEWHVKQDSLIITNDTTSISIEDGDAALIGHVAPRVSYPILSYDETTLRIERGGIIYDYHRRAN